MNELCAKSIRTKALPGVVRECRQHGKAWGFFVNNLLLIEGDDARRQSLARLLEGTGRYRVLDYPDAAHAPETQIATSDAVLISSDIRHSINYFGRSRNEVQTSPIILLVDSTENDFDDMFDEGYQVAGYLKKPFSFNDLLYRIQEILTDRRYRSSKPFTVGKVRINPASMEMLHDNGEVDAITNMQLRLLLCLLGSGGKPVSRESLLANVWGYASNTETSTIDTHIYQLRQKIEPNPSNPSILVHTDGGYFISPRDEQNE